MKTIRTRRKMMSIDAILALAVSVLLLIYLAYALLRPEKF